VINWETELALEAVSHGRLELLKHYVLEVTTEMGEKEMLSITAVSAMDAKAEAEDLVANGRVGLRGRICNKIKVEEK